MRRAFWVEQCIRRSIQVKLKQHGAKRNVIPRDIYSLADSSRVGTTSVCPTSQVISPRRKITMNKFNIIPREIRTRWLLNQCIGKLLHTLVSYRFQIKIFVFAFHSIIVILFRVEQETSEQCRGIGGRTVLYNFTHL